MGRAAFFPCPAFSSKPRIPSDYCDIKKHVKTLTLGQNDGDKMTHAERSPCTELALVTYGNTTAIRRSDEGGAEIIEGLNGFIDDLKLGIVYVGDTLGPTAEGIEVVDTT